jgi:hypothetical protein
MTVIPLYSVTYRGVRGVHVELFDREEQAIAPRDEIPGRAVIASHELRVGR